MRHLLLLTPLAVTPLAHAAGDEKVAWYADPTTATAFAALIVFLMIVGFVGGFKTIFGLLDQRAEGIQSQIDKPARFAKKLPS